MSRCNLVFTTYENDFEKFMVQLREMKKKEESLKFSWRVNTAHKKLQDRIHRMREYVQTSVGVVGVVGVSFSLCGCGGCISLSLCGCGGCISLSVWVWWVRVSLCVGVVGASLSVWVWCVRVGVMCVYVCVTSVW